MKAKTSIPDTGTGFTPTANGGGTATPPLARLIRRNAKVDGARALCLTPRQIEVLALLCQGLPNKLISRQLNISAATVKVHIGCILRELGVSSRVQAVVVAPRLGFGGPMDDTVTTPDR